MRISHKIRPGISIEIFPDSSIGITPGSNLGTLLGFPQVIPFNIYSGILSGFSCNVSWDAYKDSPGIRTSSYDSSKDSFRDLFFIHSMISLENTIIFHLGMTSGIPLGFFFGNVSRDFPWESS